MKTQKISKEEFELGQVVDVIKATDDTSMCIGILKAFRDGILLQRGQICSCEIASLDKALVCGRCNKVMGFGE